MPSKRRPKAIKRQPEVWVSSDLMQKMKGAEGNRGLHVPQSPYLVLADRFLGFETEEESGSGNGHRTAHPVQRSKEAGDAVEALPRAMAAAAGGVLSAPAFSSLPPRHEYPKPPARPTPPRPPKLAISGLPARPNPPKLHTPKPPKLTFGYRRRKVDRTK